MLIICHPLWLNHVTTATVLTVRSNQQRTKTRPHKTLSVLLTKTATFKLGFKTLNWDLQCLISSYCQMWRKKKAIWPPPPKKVNPNQGVVTIKAVKTVCSVADICSGDSPNSEICRFALWMFYTPQIWRNPKVPRLIFAYRKADSAAWITPENTATVCLRWGWTGGLWAFQVPQSEIEK